MSLFALCVLHQVPMTRTLLFLYEFTSPSLFSATHACIILKHFISIIMGFTHSAFNHVKDCIQKFAFRTVDVSDANSERPCNSVENCNDVS
jgi:hypothetical protein